jgi:hypothetical protein
LSVDEIGLLAIRVLAALAGLLIVWGTLTAAVKTFVLPRGINVWLTRTVFRVTGIYFGFRAKRASTYEQQDHIMAMYAPVSLFIMPIVLLTSILIGYMFLFWALEMRPLEEVFKLSGSSLLTLGYASVDTIPSKLLEISEAMIGLILVALLIAYLPTIYSAFAKRETNVALLEGRAGSPPSAVEMIARTHRTGELENLHEVWVSWQRWFAEIEESHTSLAALAFFRSPQPSRSWVTAAGTVLDSAALMLSTVDVPWSPRAAFCLRAGYLALRQIAEFYEIPFDKEPDPNDPICIGRFEFSQVYAELKNHGVPLKADRAQAWQDFSGWRVNYDTALLELAKLTRAPYALWSSDRSALHKP